MPGSFFYVLLAFIAFAAVAVLARALSGSGRRPRRGDGEPFRSDDGPYLPDNAADDGHRGGHHSGGHHGGHHAGHDFGGGFSGGHHGGHDAGGGFSGGHHG